MPQIMDDNWFKSLGQKPFNPALKIYKAPPKPTRNRWAFNFKTEEIKKVEVESEKDKIQSEINFYIKNGFENEEIFAILIEQNFDSKILKELLSL